MSLQVWLPLNGNLENQGLSNIEATNVGATSNANGKIGSCYYFNGTSSRIGFPEITINYPISICAWIKGETITASGTEYILSYNTPTGGTSGHAIGFGIYTGKLSIWHGGTVHSYGTALTNNIWYHVAAVVTESLYGLYLDGNLVLSGSGTQTAVNSKCITIGARSNSSGGGIAGAAYFFKGFMNDVRIYDHALSEKEVKELAKGLALHYKLDDGYAEGTTNLCAGLVAGGRTIVSNNTVRNTGENADTYWFIKPKEATVGNAIYTVSCDLSGFSTDSNYMQWGVVSQNSGLNWKTYNGHNEFTFTMPASRDGSTANIILDDNGGHRTQVFKIYNVQLEKKDHATPYVGGPGLTRTPFPVFDSSGFNYNGTPANVEIISDSPRYAKNTHFTGSTSKIHVSNLSTTGFSTTYSFVWWGKINSWSSKMFWGFSDGTRLNLYNGIYWNTGDGASDPIYKPGTTTIITTPSVNVWHHYAMTCDGSACLLYVDGELYGQAKSVKSVTGTDLYFNGWDSGGSYTSTDMSMSDFRMYSTELSAEDILELYQTSASIDKVGNIYTRELIE